MFRFPFENKVLNMITYAYLISTREDGNDNQIAEVGYLGSKTNARMFWPYGLSGHAPRGSTLISFAVNAHKQNLTAFPSHPTTRRKNMKEWEFATGNQKTGAETFYDDNGDLNILTPGGNVVIDSSGDVTITSVGNVTVTCDTLDATATTSATVTSASISLVGNVSITGNLAVTGTMLNAGVNVGGTHVHPQGVDSAGDTQQNTGVPQ